MGNSLEKALMNPPFTFQQCFVNDELDLARYLMYRRRIDEIDDAMSAAHQIYFDILVGAVWSSRNFGDRGRVRFIRKHNTG